MKKVAIVCILILVAIFLIIKSNQENKQILSRIGEGYYKYLITLEFKGVVESKKKDPNNHNIETVFISIENDKLLPIKLNWDTSGLYLKAEINDSIFKSSEMNYIILKKTFGELDTFYFSY